MAITTFEPGSDIALVGAVLPLAVAVGREGLVAAGAGVFIDGLAVDLIEMRSGKRECWTCSAKKTNRDCCRNRILTETELIEAGKWAVGTNQNFEMEYYCKVERADIYRDRIIFTFREGDKRIWQRK